MNKFSALLSTLVLAAIALSAQQAPTSKPESTQPESKTPAANTAAPRKTDKAAAYYHYTLAHMYEEQVAVYGRSDLANKAIEEYRAAIDADPTSEYLTSGLAELYAKTGRIRDAVLEAQDIIKRDPGNLEARKLLGRIYLRSLGDMQAGSGSQSVLKLAIEQYEQIIKIEPDSVDDHLLLGRLYRLNNDLTKAEAEFKTAVKLDPNSEEAVTTLAYLYNEEGDSLRATEVLSSIPDASRSAKLYSALGYTYEQQKKYKEAITAYRRAIELDRDNLDAIRGLAQNLLNDGQTEAALEQYKVIADANPEDAQTYLRIAEIYRKTGRFDEALDSLKKAQSMVQDSVEVPYNIAAVYQAQGHYDEAAQVLQDLLKKTEKAEGNYTAGEKSNRAVFLERLGTIQRDAGNTTGAIETFRKMTALGDENAVRGYQQIIDTYREAKQWQQATAVAKEAVQKLPNDRGLKMVLASQLADMGDPDKALKEVRGMLKGNNEDREVYITLAQMNTRLRRWNDAEEALKKAEDLSTKPDDKEYVLFLRASSYERQKRYDDAEAEFRKVLASDPQNTMTLNYLGYMLADRGIKLDEALQLIKKALELDPSNGAYLDSAGWAYFRLGKYEQAEENLVKASQRMSSDPTVQDHLGDLYQKTGRLKQAVTHWERALNEWNRTVAAEVEQTDVARVQKKLDAAKVKLAKDEGEKQ
ncbi:MAG TPA: tetratricopeptide repeat protein [Terriglobales bacterium]|jgi:tetratricopeptide (TPR) repeat protein|nr:tetratricopeptide repeat protein [Terriglobales bacterium]